ncbi:MAG: helix-turn-helix transcriptional regulator [Moraxellaceae bacterium]|jgi:DNA-binding transcriptional ArsR family regulator|nr:helix-turn-helix transcriptional regulator [Moraxellaceae bacterium]MDF3029715.1 helix-turn-helix transcriptional regulator [Moraxellaceae bacterium]
MKNSDALAALSALANEYRLAIFRLLVQQGPEGLAVGRIAERTGLPNATLSFHLRELSAAGLLDARKEGRFIFYNANFDTMNAVIGFLTENCCGGKPCPPSRSRC